MNGYREPIPVLGKLFGKEKVRDECIHTEEHLHYIAKGVDEGISASSISFFTALMRLMRDGVSGEFRLGCDTYVIEDGVVVDVIEQSHHDAIISRWDSDHKDYFYEHFKATRRADGVKGFCVIDTYGLCYFLPVTRLTPVELLHLANNVMKKGVDRCSAEVYKDVYEKHGESHYCEVSCFESRVWERFTNKHEEV